MAGAFDSLIGGVKPDPEDPDFPLVRASAAPFAGPRRFFTTLGRPQFQRHAGSCTAHGYGAVIEAAAQKIGADFDVCRQDLYFGSRWLEGNGAERVDGGAFPSKVREWCRTRGVLPEVVKPYNPDDVTTWRPPSFWSARRRLLACTFTPITLSADAIMAEVAQDRAVAICHSVYAQMTDGLGADGVEKPPAGKSLGGHCRTVIGYDLDHPAGPSLLVGNWWKGWGIAHPTNPAWRESCSWVPFKTLEAPRWLDTADRLAALPEGIQP